MAKGILGTKIGMTSVFNDEGKIVPVTVVQCEPNVIIQKKTVESDGYEAVQVGYKNKRASLINKPTQGHFAKANVTPKRYVKEIAGQEYSRFEVGQEIGVNVFETGEIVDVTGTSKGKGFQGVIKRHNQSRGPMAHGSRYHRGPGSMGSIDPNHVRPGKKLPGHMGHETVTIQNLEIVKIDLERHVLLIKGNVPGPKKGLVFVKHAVKSDAVGVLDPEQYQWTQPELQASEPVVEENVEAEEAAPAEEAALAEEDTPEEKSTSKPAEKSAE